MSENSERPLQTYEINGRKVDVKEFERFRERLIGNENWFCERERGGGTEGYEASDAQGQRYEIRRVSGLEQPSTIEKK